MILNKNNINIFYDSLHPNAIESHKSISKNDENVVEKEKNSEISNNNLNEEKDTLSDKENISSSSNNNISQKCSQESRQKNEISSMKLSEKNNFEILSTMGQKKLSLDRLNYFLQNKNELLRLLHF